MSLIDGDFLGLVMANGLLAGIFREARFLVGRQSGISGFQLRWRHGVREQAMLGGPVGALGGCLGWGYSAFCE
jgi:hypothetical protein